MRLCINGLRLCSGAAGGPAGVKLNCKVVKFPGLGGQEFGRRFWEARVAFDGEFRHAPFRGIDIAAFQDGESDASANTGRDVVVGKDLGDGGDGQAGKDVGFDFAAKLGCEVRLHGIVPESGTAFDPGVNGGAADAGGAGSL